MVVVSHFFSFFDKKLGECVTVREFDSNQCY